MEKTSIWEKYEKCKSYMDKKAIVTKTEKNWNFFTGRQWVGLNSGNKEMPMFNFIKPIVQYKVSTVAQNAMVATYSDMEARLSLSPIYEKLNRYFTQCWEKSKMDSMCWKILKSGAIQGDAYLYWQNGDTLKPPQVISNTAIFFSDENISSIQDQSYIIVRERWSLEAIQELARENGISEDKIKEIGTDTNTTNQVYNKDEVDDKVTVLFYMDKKDGVVRTGRSTIGAVIEPVEPISGKDGQGNDIKGLEIYPIIPYVWEEAPNSMRGISEVEQLIPNQIELNKTLARRSAAVAIGAYPRLAYNKNAIENPEDLDKVGVAIAVEGGADSINQMIGYLNATNISSDADKLTADLLQTSKDLAGATDYAMGNINPEYASGQAIIAVRDQSQIPLNEQVARFKQFVEDIALLWADLWITYNPNGITYETEVDGMAQTVQISQDELNELKPTVKVDVSPDNRWTKLAEQQVIDNLFAQQQLSLEEYVEVTPDNASVPKAKLKAILERRKSQQQMMEQQQMGQPYQGEDEIDPQIVYEELLRQGLSEEEAQELMAQI